jgi:metal-sulfur cluster biosynthetic enzyme
MILNKMMNNLKIKIIMTKKTCTKKKNLKINLKTKTTKSPKPNIHSYTALNPTSQADPCSKAANSTSPRRTLQGTSCQARTNLSSRIPTPITTFQPTATTVSTSTRVTMNSKDIGRFSMKRFRKLMLIHVCTRKMKFSRLSNKCNMIMNGFRK